MNEITYQTELENCHNIADIYELIKKIVRTVIHRSRSGIMLGIADLGEGSDAWIGGFHVISSNAIVLNSKPIHYLEQYHPELYKAYILMVLLHEYLHSLGYIDENLCRIKTLEICKFGFGEHLVTQMAENITQFLPYFRQVQYGWRPSSDPSIYYLLDFDRSSVSYVI